MRTRDMIRCLALFSPKTVKWGVFNNEPGVYTLQAAQAGRVHVVLLVASFTNAQGRKALNGIINEIIVNAFSRKGPFPRLQEISKVLADRYRVHQSQFNSTYMRPHAVSTKED